MTNPFETTKTKTVIREKVLQAFYEAIAMKSPGETFVMVTLPGQYGFLEKQIASDFLAGKFNGVKIELICCERQKKIFYQYGPNILPNTYDFIKKASGSSDKVRFDWKPEMKNPSFWFEDNPGFMLHGCNMEVKDCLQNEAHQKVDFAWIDLCGVPSIENMETVEKFIACSDNLFITFCRNIRNGTAPEDLKNTKSKQIIKYLKNRTGKDFPIVWEYQSQGVVRKTTPMVTFGYTQQTTKTNNMKNTKQTTTLQNEVKSFAIKLMSKGYESKEVAAALNLHPPTVRAWKAWQNPVLAAKKVN